MDEFVTFNYLLIDTSGSPGTASELARGERRERVDLIARQFRDFLRTPAPPGDKPRGMLLTDDFKLRGQATREAGWLAFLVERREAGQLEEVALLAFTRGEGHGAAGVLRRLEPHTRGRQLPPAPLAVAVLLVQDVPSVVTELLTKAAAGYFSQEFEGRRDAGGDV